MKTLAIALMLFLGIGIAVDDSDAIATDPPAAAEDADKPAADAEPQAKKKELRLPPGFKERKRGRFVLYCKRDTQMGTRLKSETCFDEAQMRDYILALETTKTDIDRVRAICSNPCFCGMPC